MSKKLYCGMKSTYLTREQAELHHCFAREKGRNNGRRCRYLLETYVP
jgi:hypothetical protein